MIKVILFDLFGTVFDMSSVDRSEIGNYVEAVNADEFVPLELPDSWNHLPSFDDAIHGIADLCRDHEAVVTLSNCPLQMQINNLKGEVIDFDMIIPMELLKMYKPNPQVYVEATKLFDCDPSEMLMVTANPTFGDIEGAEAAGMRTQVIRQPGTPQTIIELAETLN